ncbi:hypothetical protein FRB95_006678 [Tulasnella sp. JGI-2019a]|nr:hypothetical protein FRB93_007826 [Tulasnella sp. JGI-2019a]KAG9037124.1 hypothetical protein FRB95_006678 [Tulasnella sp. JGI-2019a]
MSTRSQIALSRRVATQARSAARSTPRSRVRFNSSTAGPSVSQTVTSIGSSPLVAGIAGGGVVLVGGYAYYHFSGTKDMVNSAKAAHQSIQSVKGTIIQNTPSPNVAIKYLRDIAKSYAVFVPGAASYVDVTFDGIDQLHDKHKDEVDAIVNKTYADIKKVVEGGKMDLATAGKVFEILQNQGKQLGELAARVGGDIVGPIIDNHPELKEKIGGSWDDLKQIAEDAKGSDVAQKAQSIYEDTSRQLGDVFSKGFSADAVKRAKDLIDQKSKEVKDLTQKAAQEVWDKGQKQYLDKAPEEVKTLFSDKNTMSTLMGGSGAMASVVAIWSKVKDISTSQAGFDEKSVQGLKDLIKQKVKDAQGKGSEWKDQMGSVGQVTFDAGWNSVKSWMKTVPGGEKALETAEDLDVSQLSALVASKKSEAQDLVKETYTDVVKVLKEKAEKAKKLVDDSSDSGDSGSEKDENTEEKKEEKPEKKDDKKKKDGKKGK